MGTIASKDVRQYFEDHGWFSGERLQAVEPMSGGVSSTVWRVALSDRQVVWKQPLERLNVVEDWRCDTARAVNEAKALSAAEAFLPAGAWPILLAVDVRDRVLVMEALPEDAPTWKARLMGGEADPCLAARAGELLGTMQGATRDRPTWRTAFPGGNRYFDELRLDPFFRFTARRHPEVKDALERLVVELSAEREVVVHGDFSPKNFIVAAPQRLVLLDWEIVHYGSALFDPAFLLAHLSLKAIHMGKERLDGYLGLSRAFWDAYCARLGTGRAVFARIHPVLAAILLARVDGKSPAEYLTEHERVCVRKFALTELHEPGSELEDYLSRLAALPSS